MTELSAAEFAALRQTIQTRGGARIYVFLAGFAVWAVALTLVLIWLPNPIAAVIPLLVLVATFEAVRVLHLGVERIGRYIQVFYEEAADATTLTPPAWERAAMQLGPSLPGAGGHPLFLLLFVLATLTNGLAIVFPGPLPVEALSLAVPHATFLLWLLYCDRGMRKQRSTDLARYRALKNGGS